MTKKLLLHGVLNVNCYILSSNSLCVIIDPGAEKEVLQKYVEENNLKVIAILLTHGHVDHIGAVDSFDVPIYMHKSEKEVFVYNYDHVYEEFGVEYTYDYEKMDFNYIEDNEILKLGDFNIKCIHTPGHSQGSMCYIINDNIYTGDTLFKGTVGTCKYDTGNEEELKESIKKILNEDENLIVYAGHGAKTTIKREKEKNPYYLKIKNN